MSIKATMTRGSRHEKKIRNSKPDELLASVVRETPVAAALEALRRNEEFALPSGTSWAILMLSAESIGGLSRRHGRDEAKGSIVELIDADIIQTVATEELLVEEAFGIIPSVTTLDRMEEFSLLTQAEYAWTVIWARPEGDLQFDVVGEATFAQAKAVRTGVSTLREVLGESAWSKHSGEAAEPNDGPQESTPSTISGGTDEQPDLGEAVANESTVEQDVAQPALVADAALQDEAQFDTQIDDESGESVTFDDGLAQFDDGDEDAEVSEMLADEDNFDEPGSYEEVSGSEQAAVEAYESYEGVPVADAQQARDVIARRFLSEDLDLEISLEEFNTSFGIGAPIPQIEVESNASDWLGGQVAHLNRQANADLVTLRAGHDDQLRMLYIKLMSQHAEQLVRSMSTTRDGSDYKVQRDRVESEHERTLSTKDETIRTLKSQILAGYEETASKVGEQAALQAQIQFKERNRSKMEREQAAVVAEVESNIETQRADAMHAILGMRQRDATLKMERGTTLVYEVLAEQREEFLEQERELLASWNTDIQALIDEHRKDDVSRVAALAEQQRSVDEVSTLRRAQEDELATLRAAHTQRVDDLERDLERSRNEHRAELDARELQWQQSLNVEAERAQSQTGQVSYLYEQLGKVDAESRTREDNAVQRYKHEIATLKDDRAADTAAMGRMSEMQRRANSMLTVLIIALSLLMLTTGLILGAIFLG